MKKGHAVVLIFVIFIALIAVGVIWYSMGPHVGIPTAGPGEASKKHIDRRCTDSDGGRVPDVKGTARGLSVFPDEGVTKKTDYCIQKRNGEFILDNNARDSYLAGKVDKCGNDCGIMEYSCAKRIIADVINCPTGCKNGACVSAGILELPMPPTPQLTCTDTDGGNNPNLLGQTTGVVAWWEPIAQNVKVHDDFCTTICDGSVGSGKASQGPCLVEFSCQSHPQNGGPAIFAGFDVIKCPSGCVNGVCAAAPAPQPSCTDSDGDSPNTLGSVTEINQFSQWRPGTFKDVCVTDVPGSNLAEGICEKRDDGYFYGSQKYYNCPNGCKDGACNPSGAPQTQSTCTPIVVNGLPQNKIDVVFLSDGFTSQTMPLFDTAVGWALDWDGTSKGLFSKTPFKENKNKFNIYKISSDMLSNCGQCTSPQAVSCGANEYFFDVSKQACGIEPDFVIKVHNRLCPDGNPRVMAFGGGGTYRTTPISIMLFSEDLSDQHAKEILQGITNHETGHALGQFTEEYASGNLYHEFWNYPNVDNAGCPKWCSGQIDTNQPCYQTYLTWLQCVQPFLTFLNQPCGRIGDQYSCVNEQIRACSSAAWNSELAAGRDWLACNIGTNCIAGTGCFWGGGMSLRNWRATYQGIMRESIAESYGARDEKILQDRINQLTQG